MTGPSPAADPRHIAMAFAVAASFARRFPRLADEFESECLVALCEAAASFDPGRGVKFSTHAGHRIKGAMLDVLRHWAPCGFRRDPASAPSVGSLDAPAATGGPGGPAIPSGTLPADEGPVGWEAEYQDELRGLARRATRDEGEAIVRLYGHADTATMKRAAGHLGVCASRVSQRHVAGMGRLSERFAGRTPGEVFMHGTAQVARDESPWGVTMGSDEDDEATAGAAGAATVEPPVPADVDAPARSCPDCGRPYGKRIRCYACRPAGAPFSRRGLPPKGGAAARVGPPPDAPSREVDAMRSVAAALGGLSPSSASRVLAWAASHFAAEGGGA